MSLTPKLPQVDARSVYSNSPSPYESQDRSDYVSTNYSKSAEYELPTYPSYSATYNQNEHKQYQPVEPSLATAPYTQRPLTAESEEQGVIPPKRSRWKKPWFCWLISVVQVAVFLGQCGHAWKLTGSPIQTSPINPMIGPSVYNAINMGARYPLCMKYISNVTDVVTEYPCPNTTTTSETYQCSLAELCGNDAKNGEQPRQWWRFIVPIFLHAGILHIGFNLLVQLRLGAQVEMDIGVLLFVPIYFAAGIGGFLFGGNFAGAGIVSMGASGAIFGIISLTLLEHLYHWHQIANPIRGLSVILADVIISMVLGLLPGVDNFSHIGGFIVGLLLGVAVLRSPDALDRRMNPYTKVNHGRKSQIVQPGLSQQPDTNKLKFFEGRKPAWWLFSGLRLVCLILTLVCFVLLIKVESQTLLQLAAN